VTAVEGDAGEAAVLQGAAERIWPSVGLPLFGSVYFGRPRVECEEQVRRELGDAAYEAGLRAGKRLDRAGAVERALGGGGSRERRDTPRAGGGPAPGATRRPAASRMTGRGGPERW